MLNKSISIIDLGKNKEYAYHSLLSGMISVNTSDLWELKSNKETGNGFADLVIQNILEAKAIIIEIKVADKEEDMQKMLDEAQMQITKNKYGENLIIENYDIAYYAFCFYKKSVKIRLLG